MIKNHKKKKIIMKMTLKNSLWVFFFLVLFLGIFRFVYSTVYKDSVSLLKPSHAINNTIKSYVIGDEVGIEKIPRRWGPVSVALIKGIEKFIPKNYEPLVWRLGLFISYGFAIYFFVKLISEFKEKAKFLLEKIEILPEYSRTIKFLNWK